MRRMPLRLLLFAAALLGAVAMAGVAGADDGEPGGVIVPPSGWWQGAAAPRALEWPGLTRAA